MTITHPRSYYMDAIDKHKTGISKRSLETYAYSLMWLDRRMEQFDPFDVDAALEYLGGHTPSRKKASMNALQVWARCHGRQDCCHKLKAPYRTCCDGMMAERSKQQRSKREEQNWVDFKPVRNFARDLRTEVFALPKNDLWGGEAYHKAQLAFILTYHLRYPIRRDLMTVLRTEDIDREHQNYVDEATQQFVYNNFKTHKHMGRVTHRLSRPMWRLYRLLCTQQNLGGRVRTHVLLNKHWRPFSKCGYTVWLQTEMRRRCPECAGKRFGCGMLRKCVITHRRKDQWSNEERACFAKDCMHSETENSLYDKRLSCS